MIKKRLAGVITVRNGWAVQSFGYRRYLPIGKPEVVAANLDRWGADEIILQCIDRAARGPDLDLLDKVSRLGLSTPLIYGGGIRDRGDAIQAIQRGADRIVVDSLLHDNLEEALRLAEPLGAQAIIAALPLSMESGEALWLDHRSGQSQTLPATMIDALTGGSISEALIIDWKNEGNPDSFDETLLQTMPGKIPLIVFGGISEPDQLSRILGHDAVVAAGVGNFLNYREHAIQKLKAQLGDLPLRAPHYESAS